MAEPPQKIPFNGPHTEDELELFGRFRHLVPVLLEGRPVTVPEDNCVLRACQYVEMSQRQAERAARPGLAANALGRAPQMLRMPWKDYCWNDTQGCCEMRYRPSPDAAEQLGRACRVQVQPGMEIVKLPKGGRWCTPRS